MMFRVLLFFLAVIPAAAHAEFKKEIIAEPRGWIVTRSTDSFTGSVHCGAEQSTKSRPKLSLSRDSPKYQDVSGFIFVGPDYRQSAFYKVDDKLLIVSRSMVFSGAFISDAGKWKSAQTVAIQYLTTNGKTREASIPTEAIGEAFEVLSQARCGG